MTGAFWDTVNTQVAELRSARTANDVLRILAHERNPYGAGASSADGFYAGSGGDQSVEDALATAGWEIAWRQAHYYYAMRAPDGSVITYIEGDIYVGDRRPRT